jgi:hypothetical protein
MVRQSRHDGLESILLKNSLAVNLLENAKALESLKFETSGRGPAIFGDISPQSIVVRQSAGLCLVFSHNMIYARNSWRAGN